MITSSGRKEKIVGGRNAYAGRGGRGVGWEGHAPWGCRPRRWWC